MERYILVGHEPKLINDPLLWGIWMEDLDNRQIMFTELEDGTFISTVFLGLDHSFGGGPPLLFETMIGKTDRMTNATTYEDQWRYTTWEQAETGHREAVRVALSRVTRGNSND